MKYFISQIVFLEQDTIDSLFSNGIQFDDANESLFDCFTATLTEGADAVVANKIAGSPNGNRFSIKLSLTHLRYEAFYILNCFFFSEQDTVDSLFSPGIQFDDSNDNETEGL